MKTTFDIENAVYGVLNVSGFKSLFTGTLFNGRIPSSRTVAEDAVVMASTVNNEQVQSGLVSVKCWAKDISGLANPKLNDTIKKIVELVESASVDGFEFSIMSSYVIPDDKNPGWSIGIVRVECFINNL